MKEQHRAGLRGAQSLFSQPELRSTLQLSLQRKREEVSLW